MKWTDELVKKVERFIEIKNKGLYADGTEIARVYNEVLEKRITPTNCGACNRARVSELETALNHFKASEALKKVEVDNAPQEVNKEAVKTGNNLKSKSKK